MREKTPEILYEDPDLIVCRKRAGLAVESAGAGRMDLVSLLKNYRAQREEEAYIAPVHRLDQPVEGVMVFAKNRKTAAALSAQVQAGSWEKDYLALVCGKPPAPRGHLEHYLLRDGRKNMSKVVSRGTKGARKAVLDYEILSIKELSAEWLSAGDFSEESFSGEDFCAEGLTGTAKEKAAEGLSGQNLTLVQIHLLTGRHHQIRVQLAASGMPIYADAKYGTAVPGTPAALCAWHLHFVHPGTAEEMDFRIRPSFLSAFS